MNPEKAACPKVGKSLKEPARNAHDEWALIAKFTRMIKWGNRGACEEFLAQFPDMNDAK